MDVFSLSGELKGGRLLAQGRLLKGVSFFDLSKVDFDMNKMSGTGTYEFNLLGNDIKDLLGKDELIWF